MTPTALWVVAIGLAAAAGPPADPREAARLVIERGGYQTDLPGAHSTQKPTPEPSRRSMDAGSRSGAGGEPRASRGSASPSLVLPPQALVWTLLAVLIAIGLAWAVLRAVRSRRGADAEAAPEPEPEPPVPSRRTLRIGPLTDVEDLARQGRFGEAIHLLLLHLFAALQRRPATAPAPAHTSREVLARTRLASEARAALGVLVSAAEHVHFGGREAVREDYENCLGHYRRFLDSFERAS